MKISASLSLASLSLASLALTGCDVPSVPLGAGAGAAPTLRGGVSASGQNMRVGLLGTRSVAQQNLREIASAPVSDEGYVLTVPTAPPLDLMVSENESVIFSLRAYEDTNTNGRYDQGERLLGEVPGSLRFFVDAGPGYRAGWNAVREDGTYAQSFQTAYNF